MNKFKNRKITSLFITTIVLFIFLIPQFAHAEPMYEILKSDSGLGGQIKTIWQRVLDAINLFVISLLIIVAFAQIFRININTYGIKKILPSLLLATIAANFSMLICRLLVDVSNVLMTFFISGPTASLKSEPDKMMGAFSAVGTGLDSLIQQSATTNSFGPLFWYMIGQILIVVAAILVLILAFLFVIRNWLVYFLIPLSPLAFMATILPQTKSLFNQWWSNFAKWVFMPVVSLFWLWLGGLWYSTVSTNSSVILSFAFSAVCYYMAITTPFKMGGSIMNTWGSVGKKAVSPAADYAKRKAALAWSNQAANGSKYNPLANIARLQTSLQDSKKFDEERIANNRQDALAKVMKSRGGRRRTQEREKFGGSVEKAKEEVLRDYLGTDAGKKWAEGRAEFLSGMNTAKTEKEAGLSGGMRRFREGQEGGKLAEDLILAQKNKELQENVINQMDKELVTSFNRGEGQFAKDKLKERNPELENMVSEYFAALARNKTLDEAVNQSSAQRVEKILGDQMYIENLKSGFKGIEVELAKETDRIRQDNKRQSELSTKEHDKTITSTEAKELDTLRKDAFRRHARQDDITRNGKKEIETRQNELLTAAKGYVEKVQGLGEHHLDGFIGKGKDGKEMIAGFAGTIRSDDQTFKDNVGFQMMTRAGKLMSIEIKADADKLLDAKTPREIGEQLINGEQRPDGKWNFTKENLQNFREGHREKNSPFENRRIEAHVIATSRTARQNTNPYRDLSRSALVSMLDDESAVSAGNLFNQLAEERGMTERISTTASPDDIRSQIRTHMGNRNNKIASLAFASVEDQRDVGLSDNPANYLSVGGGLRHGDKQSADRRYYEDPQVEPKQFSTLVRSVAASKGEYNPNLATNPDVIRHLDNITDTLRAERAAIINQIGQSSGITLTGPNNEAFKRTMNDAIMKIPRDQTDPAQIAAALNPVLKQFGGKEISGQAQISVPTVNGEKIVNLGNAAARTQSASLAIQSAELTKMHPQVQQIEPQLVHFSRMEGGKAAVDTAMHTLEEALNGAGGVRSPKVDTDQIKKVVNDAIRKVGMGTQVDINFESNDEAIDFLKRTRDAAAAASQGYSADGKFNLDQAHSAAAKHYLAQEKK